MPKVAGIKFIEKGFETILKSGKMKKLVRDEAWIIAGLASTPHTVTYVDTDEAGRSLKKATERGEVDESDMNGGLHVEEITPHVHGDVFYGNYGGGRVIGVASTNAHTPQEAEAAREALEEAVHRAAGL